MATEDAIKKPKTMRRAGELAADYINALDARFSGARKHHIPSGFATLDKLAPGWLHEGHLIIVAGRPGMGKSAFAQQIAEFVAAQQRTVILYTLEMSGYEIVERALSRRSNISIPTLKTADSDSLTDDSWRRIVDALAKFSPLPLLIDDGTIDIASIVGKTKGVAKHIEQQHVDMPQIGCVVVDYLQLVSAKALNRTLEIGQVTSALKRLAKELHVPVIALSQLNRGVEGRHDKRPTLADLRESGQIEQDADIVIMLYRDEYYKSDSPDKGTAEIIIAKNRHGTTGTLRLAFMGERLMFGDLAHG